VFIQKKVGVARGNDMYSITQHTAHNIKNRPQRSHL